MSFSTNLFSSLSEFESLSASGLVPLKLGAFRHFRPVRTLFRSFTRHWKIQNRVPLLAKAVSTVFSLLLLLLHKLSVWLSISKLDSILHTQISSLENLENYCSNLIY